jgi:hypothetical protein
LICSQTMRCAGMKHVLVSLDKIPKLNKKIHQFMSQRLIIHHILYVQNKLKINKWRIICKILYIKYIHRKNDIILCRLCIFQNLICIQNRNFWSFYGRHRDYSLLHTLKMWGRNIPLSYRVDPPSESPSPPHISPHKASKIPIKYCLVPNRFMLHTYQLRT